MAEAIIGPLVGRLQELAFNEAQKVLAVHDDIRSLRDKLMWMQAFLHDAGPQRRVRNDELMRVYLKQTRDAVFDAEDAVDQYFLQVDLSRFKSWTHAMLKFLTDCTIQIHVRRELSSRIKSINTRLESIIANRDRYKMDDEATKPTNLWRPSKNLSTTAEKLDEDSVVHLYGRDKYCTKLKELLTSVTEKLMVITVVGKSGVGKTMLVKEVYEGFDIQNHFYVRVWVSSAPNLSASNIQRLILLRLEEGDETCRKEDLEDELKKALRIASGGTTDQAGGYLLVIDGEVSNTEWRRILESLPSENKNSRIVRITQAKPEAGSFAHETIELGNFSKDTSTELFLNTLLMEERGQNQPDIENCVKRFAEVIFHFTDGLPLAVVLLSGLLRTKEYPGEWSKVFTHLKEKSVESKRLDIILAMCFDDLPHNLKSCFLYFAALPVNSLFKACTLVCMWMAEGFLSPIEGKTMEQVGRYYMKELIDRRLVILPPLEYAIPGEERVTVQTRVHDFLLLEAREGNFVEIHSGDDAPTLSTARRLSLQNHRDKYTALGTPLPKLRSIFSNFEIEEPDSEEQIKAAEDTNDQQNSIYPTCLPRCKDRSTRPNPKDLIRNLLHVSQFLRVICLDGLEVGEELPSEIGNVVHLQYLGITSCSLKKIPKIIGKLKHLQTLDVRGTKVTTLPVEFWRIRTLRHVLGLHLQLPNRAGDLQYLQTLASVEPADDWDRKKNLISYMKRLQTLHIKNISAKNEHVMLDICELKHLVVLIVSGEHITQELFTRSKLSRLQVMILHGEIMHMDKLLETSIHFKLPNLTKLFLKRTKVSQPFIDKLGDLPFLSTLALYKGSCREKLIVFSKGFQSLDKLALDDVEIEHIQIKGSAFPHIASISIFTHVNQIVSLNVQDKTDDFQSKINFKLKDIPIE